MRTGEERKKPEGIVAWAKRRGRWDDEKGIMGGAGKEWKETLRKMKEGEMEGAAAAAPKVAEATA